MVHDPGIHGEWNMTSNVPGSPPAPSRPQYFLRKQGQKWELRFAGHEIVSLIPTVGIVYLWEVLRFPRKRFTVSDLVVSAHGERAALPALSLSVAQGVRVHVLVLKTTAGRRRALQRDVPAHFQMREP